MGLPSTYTEIRDKIIKGDFSVAHIVEHYLKNIKANNDLNAFIEIYEDEALDRARSLDEKLASGKSEIGKLFGAVISIKDVLSYDGHHLSAGSKILQGYKAIYSATAIERLLQEDAIIIGRVNCDEFAMGSSNENSFYGPTKNGDNRSRVPGGSSGASAVSVQIDGCIASLGSDTGGSVRQPAAFCGVIGFKPSYGRISRHGLIAYGSSFDQIGILSKDHECIALILNCISGNDRYDSTSSSRPVDDYHNFLQSKKHKIAYINEAVEHPSLSRDNKMLFDNLKAEFIDAGHTVEGVSFRLLEFLVPAYYILTTAEASSNLGRYDGIRYGHRADNVDNLEELYKETRGQGFGLEAKRRIMLGTFVLSEGYYDAYYKKAQAARRMIKSELEEIFSHYDFIMMPTTPGKSWEIGEKKDDPVEVYLSDMFTVLANLAGIPAITCPYKKHNNTEENYGIQLLAPYMEEKTLLSFINNILFLV